MIPRAFAFEGNIRAGITWVCPAIQIEEDKVLNPITRSICNLEHAEKCIHEGYLTRLPFEVEINYSPVPKVICLVTSNKLGEYIIGGGIEYLGSAGRVINNETIFIKIIGYSIFKLYCPERCDEIFEDLLEIKDWNNPRKDKVHSCFPNLVSNQFKPQDVLREALILDFCHPKLLAMKTVKLDDREYNHQFALAILSNKSEKLEIYHETIKLLDSL